MINQQMMDELLEAAKPSIIEGLKKELSQSISWEAKQTMQKQVVEHVSAWVQENVLPEITAQLVESREGIISVGPEMARLLVEQLAQGFADTIAKKMESSWERKKIFEALIG